MEKPFLTFLPALCRRRTSTHQRVVWRCTAIDCNQKPSAFRARHFAPKQQVRRAQQREFNSWYPAHAIPACRRRL